MVTARESSLCDRLCDQLVVTTGAPGAGGTRRASAHLPPDRDSAARARELVRSTFQQSGCDDDSLLERLVLMTSEVVTNAILHAKTDIDLVITVDGCQARLEVSDHSEARLAPVEAPALDDTSGRGLFVVTALADDWGVVDLEGGKGKTVWIQLAVR